MSLPIGNDGDIGRRAIEVLERVDLVLAEDTRRLRALAQRIGIDVARATSYHDHNEAQRVDGVLERLRGGARVALVSDAGTPLCSDPGLRGREPRGGRGHSRCARCPVRRPRSRCSRRRDSRSTGSCSAASCRGDRTQRQQAVRELTAIGCAVVFYEAAPRLAETLADIAAVCPEWRVCLGREVTKTFEEFRYGARRGAGRRDRGREAAR